MYLTHLPPSSGISRLGDRVSVTLLGFQRRASGEHAKVVRGQLTAVQPVARSRHACGAIRGREFSRALRRGRGHFLVAAHRRGVHDFSILLVILAGIVGCGGAPSLAEAPGFIPIQELPTVLAARFCAAGGGSALAGMPLLDCVQVAMHGKELRQRLGLVENGRLEYNGAAAATCLTGLTADNEWVILTMLGAFRTSRAGDPLVPADCQQVFRGSISMGGACDDDAECQSGRCWGCPTGICTTPGSLGATCGRQRPCEAGSLCFLGECVADVGLPKGATCTSPEDQLLLTQYNDLWFSHLSCVAPLRCIGTTSGIGECAIRLPDDASCANDWACQQGHSCVAAKCSKPAPHYADLVCGGTMCSLSETCDGVTGKCRVVAAPGSSCAGNELCAGSTCSVDSQTCVPSLACAPSCSLGDCHGGVCSHVTLGSSCSITCPDDGLWPPLTCLDNSCRRGKNPACSFPAVVP